MNIAQSLENLKLEQDAIVLYDALARVEKDPRRAAAFRHIANNERRHADIWAARLAELGASVPPAGRPRMRVRLIIVAARLLGTRAVSDLVKSLEGDEEAIYEAQGDHPDIESIAADEREHAQIWERLDARAAAAAVEPVAGEAPAAASPAAASAEAPAAEAPPGEAPGAAAGGRRPSRRRSVAADVITAAAHPAIDAGRAESPETIQRGERWHRSGRSGTLRATIFGVSDGLVSNLSLVMGVAGASDQGGFILLAGIAGLLAGAFSMAAGEYISMQSQRELFERQIELERAELEAMPEEEQRELTALYMAKGFSRGEAGRIAARMFEDPKTALDTLVREELGLDPDELGSPWGAALGSFIAFCIGAAIPVIPYLFGGGTANFIASLGISLAALFLVGAGVSLLTGRSLLFSGLRQTGLGAAAAAVTFGVGKVIGVGLAG